MIVKEITLNEDVFLAGYSEGGYFTLAAQKDIEINLTAVAPMAGRYDFREIYWLMGNIVHLIM